MSVNFFSLFDSASKLLVSARIKSELAELKHLRLGSPRSIVITTDAVLESTGLAARNCARPRWERFVDQSSVGATRYHGPDSIRKCLDYCLNTSACVAVDVEVNVYPPGCWPHLNSSRLSESNTYYLAGTNQYRLTSCSSDVTGACTILRNISFAENARLTDCC